MCGVKPFSVCSIREIVHLLEDHEIYEIDSIILGYAYKIPSLTAECSVETQWIILLVLLHSDMIASEVWEPIMP